MRHYAKILGPILAGTKVRNSDAGIAETVANSFSARIGALKIAADASQGTLHVAA